MEATDVATSQRLNQATFDAAGQLRFFGLDSAALFTREVEESFRGVLTRNMITDPNNPMVGFVSASIDGRPWTNTMWARDAGVFLRELVQWGYFTHACLLAENLMKLVRKNSAGYCTFPEHFEYGKPGSGSELDGTGAIIIGMVLLWERLPSGHPTREHIAQFLRGADSPLVYIASSLSRYPLIPGSGEFGAGCGIPGEKYNVVQNNLVRLALLAVVRLARKSGDVSRADTYAQCAEQLSCNMLQYLWDEDGSWIWCINPVTLLGDPEILNHVMNKGFGGINGVLSMSADVMGFRPEAWNWDGLGASIKTFEKLFAYPLRKALFGKYGVWTQFDEFCMGYVTSPSYGHGYALQTMLLTDRLGMAERAIDFLVQATYRPLRGNLLNRDSSYFFYERYYLPELADKTATDIASLQPTFPIHRNGQLDEGCGALNLVCVAEPLKTARLIMGVDDVSPDTVKIVPRLPSSWSGYEADNWPIYTSNGVVRADIQYEQGKGKAALTLQVRDGQRIPNLAVRLTSVQAAAWQFFADVTTLNHCIS